ncbi:MAG: FKBP-type peptidyl-prolyl cis-trans isomerase [Bifidobacteriaceae bacterium]|jgi:peptidylprolyl isomerase|nr:FKBP-type peptidyl-prolyl cis-trans isomerase [Bifidobacteriaceae bacterium]
MQKRLALATLVCVGLATAACGGPTKGDGESPTPSDGDTAGGPLAAITWVDGDPPSLDFAKPFNLGQESASRVMQPGDGEEIKAGDLVLMNYVVLTGEDGTATGSTYDAGSPDPIVLTETQADGDYIWPAVVGQQVGAKVVVAFTIPAEQLSSDATEPPTVDPTYLVALTLTKAQDLLASAEGETVVPDGEASLPGVPTVSFGTEGKPSIAIPEGVDPPTELVSELLIEGTGDAVAADQAVAVNYSGWLWDGTMFDSSWEGGQPAAFFLDQVIAGWTQGLAGQAIGSRVLLVIPPDLGYQDQDQGSIPANSTLIFVVDILGAA